MKVLLIGGTGIISSACTELALAKGFEVTVLNRGTYPRGVAPKGIEELRGDIKNDPESVAALLAGRTFDSVVDFISFTPDEIERNLKLFASNTRQFIFISSASVYQKPLICPTITEDTPLSNPFWDYSRQKIACEERLLRAYREEGFPVTIVRPSLTYGPMNVPLVLNSWMQPWTLLDRIQRGLPVVVPGDGTSLWTITWNGDFAKGLVGLLGRETTLGHAFHITSDEVLSWNTLFTEVSHALGVAPKLVHVPSDVISAHFPDLEGTLHGDKIHSGVFDNSKIKRFVPDYVATVSWAEGVRRALAFFDEDSSRKSIDAQINHTQDTLIAAIQRSMP